MADAPKPASAPAPAPNPAPAVTKSVVGPEVDPKDYIGGKDGETKWIKVYGTKKLEVDTRFARVNKGYVLTAKQDKLAKNLRLDKYLANKDIQILDKKEWLSDILYEIVVLDCRTDPSIMLKSQCPNFGAYLRDLSFRLFKTKKLPIKDNEIEILGGIKVSSSGTSEAAEEAAAAAKTAEEAAAAAKTTEEAAAKAKEEAAAKAKAEKFGNLTIKIHIPRAVLELPPITIDTIYNTINATMQMQLALLRRALNRDTSEIQLSDIQSSIYSDMNKYIQNLKRALSA
jgi:hypothetical protein